MTDSGLVLDRSRASSLPGARPVRRLVTLGVVAAIVVGNAALIVWLWVDGGNATDVHSTGDVLTSEARRG